MKSITRILLRAVFLLSVLTAPFGGASGATKAKVDDVLLSAMQRELQRAGTELGKLDPPPYYTGYAVYNQESTLIAGSLGSLVNSAEYHRRTGEVRMRVGTPALDNTHGTSRSSGIISQPLPLNDDANAIARLFWQLSYEEYRKAAKSYLNVKTTTAVRTEEEDTSADFSDEKPQVHLVAEPATQPSDSNSPLFHLDRKAWEDKVRRYSAYFKKYPEIYTSMVMVLAQQTKTHSVASDGNRVVTAKAVVRMAIQAETQAEDGMELLRVETFQAATPEALPGDAEISARIETMAADLKKLRAAPLAEPFNGPALLSGRAAAVFFHEVLGHRLEGHRQRGDEEGQTFTKKIGQPVLPTFLSVVDDPTQLKLNGTDLSGWYDYDDEGVPAQKVEVIKDGILKSFLMSRMPVKNFANSNGHGRSQPGQMPTGRQGNLIVTSSKSIKDSDLRQKLVEEIKKQNKPYGLYFEDIQGGFTLTTRNLPQAFQVLPVMVWRVYPDDRPDELVRGVDIVGTPLAALNQIELTGDKLAVFNGVCGAESGDVPVSAAAPAMLFSALEVQKRAHDRVRPPLLPPPGFEDVKPAAKNGAGQ